MTAIPENYLNSVCEIKAMNNKPLASGTISVITADYIQIQFKEDDMILLPPNTVVKVSILNAKLGFRVVVGKVYVGNRDFIRIVEIITLVDFEKRDFFRIAINEYTVFYDEIITPEETYYSKAIPTKVLISNISLSGIYFFCPKRLGLGEKIYVVIDLSSGRSIFPCIVRRIEEDTEEDIYGYGCEFVDHNQRQSDNLYRYIFEKQLSFLKKEDN